MLTLPNLNPKLFTDLLQKKEMIGLVCERVENIAEKRENALYQPFLFLLQCFQRMPFSRSFKLKI